MNLLEQALLVPVLHNGPLTFALAVDAVHLLEGRLRRAEDTLIHDAGLSKQVGVALRIRSAGRLVDVGHGIVLVQYSAFGALLPHAYHHAPCCLCTHTTRAL